MKYPTDLWEGVVNEERYTLRRQSAQDIRSYDCVNDIARVEGFIESGYAHSGLVLILANDSYYWRLPTRPRVTNADALRLHEGRTLTGSCAWGPNVGAGTPGLSRTNPIDLVGHYQLAWRDYSNVLGTRGQLWYLAVPVSSSVGRRPPTGGSPESGQGEGLGCRLTHSTDRIRLARSGQGGACSRSCRCLAA